MGRGLLVPPVDKATGSNGKAVAAVGVADLEVSQALPTAPQRQAV